MPTNSICPKCSAPIAEGAPQGLCPKCVLLGVATTAGAAKPRTKEPQAPSPQEIAPHFPELEVLELIGVGGMGAVYKARQIKLGRLVALKILSSSLAEDPEFLERFDREARVLGRMSHPGIVTIFDSGVAGPCAYLLMEFVDGVNLRQAMQSGGFKPSEALAVTQEICSALEYAHGQGILHRDIKPENILIDGSGRVKIADFGIAKLVGDQGPDHATLTMRGAVLGSMSYMAPEQFDAPGDVDQRADIYSLGVVLYELLTGELPRGRFGPPSDKSAVDARIDEIVMRTLEREREARFQNVHQMKTQMDAATQPGIAPAPASESVLGPKTAHAPIQREQTTPRFSLAAAILTGISLPLVIIVFVAFTTRLPGPPGPVEHVGSNVSVGAILALLSALATLCCAVIGFILGARALGEIRRSGGVKTGLGSAIFATTAWPILFLFFLATLTLKIPSSGEGPSLGPVAVIFFVVLVPVLVAAWLLVRSLYRWAGGVERKDGTRFHPGFGISLLMVMLLTIGGPLLLAVTARLILPAGERRDPSAESQRFMEEENLRHNANLAKAYGAASVDWYRGGPEVLVQLGVHPRYRAEFRLVQYEGEDPKKSADIGSWVPYSKPDSNPGMDNLDTCLVFIGTTKPREGDPEGTRGVTVHLSGNKESGHLSTETDFAKWKWHSETLVNLPPLATVQRYSFKIASREESVDGKSKVTGMLLLEVQLVERKP